MSIPYLGIPAMGPDRLGVRIGANSAYPAYSANRTFRVGVARVRFGLPLSVRGPDLSLDTLGNVPGYRNER